MLNINQSNNPIQCLSAELFSNIFCSVKEINFIYNNKDKLTIKRNHNHSQYPSGCVLVYFQQYKSVVNRDTWFVMGHQTFDGISNYEAVSCFEKRLRSETPWVPVGVGKHTDNNSVEEINNTNIDDCDFEVRFYANDISDRLFFIQTPRYGTNLSDYNKLFIKAKEYFPNLKQEDISVGVVGNTGFMDNHAVISFSRHKDEIIPNSFKELKWENWFKW